MVTWNRKVQEVNEQYTITLPKRWIKSLGIQSKQELEIKEMKREQALKIKPSGDEQD